MHFGLHMQQGRIEAPSGVGYVGRVTRVLSPADWARLRERRELPSGVRGGAPAANASLTYFGVTERF